MKKLGFIKLTCFNHEPKLEQRIEAEVHIKIDSIIAIRMAIIEGTYLIHLIDGSCYVTKQNPFDTASEE